MIKRLVVYDELENGHMLSYEVGEEGCIEIHENVEEGYCLVTFVGGTVRKITDYLLAV